MSTLPADDCKFVRSGAKAVQNSVLFLRSTFESPSSTHHIYGHPLFSLLFPIPMFSCLEFPKKFDISRALRGHGPFCARKGGGAPLIQTLRKQLAQEEAEKGTSDRN